jgi:peptidoglycan glycosyltransferase
MLGADIDPFRRPETRVSSSYRSQAYPVQRPVEPPRSTAGWVALIVFAFLAGIGVIVAFAVITAYASISSNLPDPVKGLTNLTLPEETVILDRTGKTELARFGEFKRDVATFEEIPPVMLDATTAIEDKTFWENAGFDPVAIFAAGLDSIRGSGRGASTITQQLVRARLLDPELVQDPNRTVERKLKEILQSIRVTQAFPGEQGKQQIITAYLNLNYYGNQTYGVKAAARGYFGKALKDITPGEAAIIAALPQSPSNYDLVRNAEEHCDVTPTVGDPCPAASTHLVVPADSKIAQRRDAVLTLLAGGRTPMSGSEYSSGDFEAAEGKDVELAPQAQAHWLAPHFVWAVRDELANRLCGAGVSSCEALDAGGLRVTTTLDLKLQKVAEKWIKAATIVPHRADPAKAAKALGFDTYESWMRNLEDKNVRNGALVAMDYQTGQVIAYVGSAEYYATQSRPEFQPQYDVVGQGFRQPGSAFKPFNYAIGIDEKAFTAGDMLMDTATDFGGGYSPTDADNLERGPVRVRTALQFSLNIPAVRAMAINQPDHVFARVKDFGMTFQGDTTDAGLALALGVAETRPIDLVTAYSTLANGGVRPQRTSIISVTDRSGAELLKRDPAKPTRVISPQAAFIVTDILSGNTNRRINPFWGKFSITGPGDARRPATLKTGTNNDAKDLNAYGFVAPPTDAARKDGAYALAVGVWNGNSDNTPVSTPAHPVFSIDVATYEWQGFLQEASQKWPIAKFAQPKDGLVQTKIDAFTGMLPTSGDDTVDEWFLAGTEPKAALPKDTCGDAALQSVGHEHKFPNWIAADQDWIRRAQRGAGTAGGPDRTRTAYFYNSQFNPYGRSWGPFVSGHGCGSPSPSPSCIPLPTPDASGLIPSFSIPSPTGSEIAALPCPPAPATPSPSVSAEPTATPAPTPTDVRPTPKPRATPTPAPTPEPTPPPSAGASPAAP